MNGCIEVGRSSIPNGKRSRARFTSIRLAVTLIIGLCVAFAPVYASDWSINQPVELVPDTSLSGVIFGRDFELGEATFDNITLTIRSKKKMGGWPESEILIFVGRDDEVREWTVTPNSDDGVPHIHMKFAKKGKTFPSTLMYIGEYSMKLKIEEISDSKANVKLHLSLPDYKKSFLIGSFIAHME
jgi:hypothetical protein